MPDSESPSPSAESPSQAADSAMIAAGTVVGAFTLLQPLGEGGMGEVWEAEQRHPIRRHVAIKFLKLGLDTKAFLARFEIERQALAVMDHPGIARVLDAGATASGRPFYVMELVRGMPLTEFCDTYRLTTEHRLELFADVCHAVQHAHQKGVIHRDLKPSNVLVTMVDDRPVPKVIDFGIAKAVGGQLTDITFFTEIGRPVGTPAYMSPEQWEQGQFDIDTRSDVYSLGVILYELLAGRLPNDTGRLLLVGAAVAQLMREMTPPAPSTRVKSLGNETNAVAHARRTDPRGLSRELKGDLDWITLKAMDPDRSRRYDTAHAIAQDIVRHLHAEPVTARPPSITYRAGRFVRRNRAGVVLATLVLLGGVGFTGQTVVQARRLKVERDRAALAARLAGANAEMQKALLSLVESDSGRMTADERLDKVQSMMEKQFADDPIVQSSLLMTLADRYGELNQLGKQVSLTRRAATQAHQAGDSVVEAKYRCLAAWVHFRLDQPDTASAQLATALTLLKTPRRDERVQAEIACNTARSSQFVLRQEFDSATARTRASVQLLESIGDTNSSDYDVALNNLALSLNQSGRQRDAADVLGRLAALLVRKGGENSNGLLVIVSNRAGVFLQLGEFAGAREQLEREAARLRMPGSATPLPPMIAYRLIMAYQQLGLVDSVTHLASALLRDNRLGLPPSVLVDVRVALADAELQGGHAAEARREAASVARMVAQAGAGPPRARARPALLDAALLQAGGQNAQALDSLQRFLSSAGYKSGVRSEAWLAPLLLRASACALATGDNARAAAFARDAGAAASVDVLAAMQSAIVGEALSAEARALKGQGNVQGARDLASKALVRMRYGYGDGHPAVASLSRWVAELRP
ncbi:MAG: serine/threonine protein kinase [Gemmatimonadaceae bacterium]|nr:serine/threonine protein kinase [Gemmatimonadaceae bacterium]